MNRAGQAAFVISIQGFPSQPHRAELKAHPAYPYIINLYLKFRNPIPEKTEGAEIYLRRKMPKSISVILTTLLFILGCSIVGERLEVAGDSMAPTIKAGTKVTAQKSNEYRRGDIIAFEFPENRKSLRISRIVGLPGETVETKEGKLFVNGKPLDEPYVPEPINYASGPVTLPQGHFYVLGDNRNHSNDSHSWGTLPKDHVRGVIKP